MENEDSKLNRVDSTREVSKWWVLLSGLIFCSLGAYFFNKPAEALVSLVYYIAFAKILSGVSGLSMAFGKSEISNKKWAIAISIIDLLFGIVLLLSPYFKITLIIFLPYMLATWALFRGVLICIQVFKIKSETGKFWLPLINGIFSIIAGIFILSAPLVATLALMDVIGIFMLIMGISLVIQFCIMLFKK